jgi:hypothetical protein
MITIVLSVIDLTGLALLFYLYYVQNRKANRGKHGKRKSDHHGGAD